MTNFKMTTIQQPFSTHYSRNNLIAFLFFLLLACAVGFAINLVPSEVWNKPINAVLFGEKVAFYHLIPVILFLCFGSFFFIISKRKSFKHSHTFLVNEEQQQFQDQYNQDKSLPVNSNKQFGWIIVLFFLGTGALVSLPRIFSFVLSERGMEIWTYTALGVAVSGYIGYLTKYFKKYDQKMNQIFNILIQDS